MRSSKRCSIICGKGRERRCRRSYESCRKENGHRDRPLAGGPELVAAGILPGTFQNKAWRVQAEFTQTVFLSIGSLRQFGRVVGKPFGDAQGKPCRRSYTLVNGSFIHGLAGVIDRIAFDA